MGRLIERDEGLIRRKVREECINHKLACYLEQFLNDHLNGHPTYEVDLGYNKNYLDSKKVIIDENNNAKAIRLGIIVHIGETNQHNLIAFEINISMSISFRL